MAFGTRTIRPCSIIVGPGNKFIAEAKRQISGYAGIDMVAGPTELFVIADDSANPAWVAADMLAQAEHDIDAQVALVTNSEQFARAVGLELRSQTEGIATSETALVSLARNAVIIIAESLRDAIAIANRKAPEHLELAMDPGEERDYFAANLRNYGSLFVGHTSGEVLGDYSAGINHTLPTSGAAHWTGGLSVRSFFKTVTTLRAEKADGTVRSLKAAEKIAGAEGLAAHAAAARIRLAEGPTD
jgi:histidinol dehydrogenase